MFLTRKFKTNQYNAKIIVGYENTRYCIITKENEATYKNIICIARHPDVMWEIIKGAHSVYFIKTLGKLSYNIYTENKGLKAFQGKNGIVLSLNRKFITVKK